MSFHEVHFPRGISYGAVGGPGFKTSVLSRASGFDDRQSEWETPRSRYEVSHGIKNQAELDQLLAFFYARRGRAYGFRFRDWADYRSCVATQALSPTDQVIAVGDGVKRQFQLTKTYTNGSTSYVREIKKPVSGSVRIAVAGVEALSGWSVDTTTGIVTFTVAPANGLEVTAGYEFDVPVRFDTDKCLTTIEQFNVHTWASIPLVEIRV
ncbi:MAG: TIGR02217 family protein [Burkholderiaceae bacterium]|nr:TIGR02217 family protein [Burkholderiaceae bacterium]